MHYPSTETRKREGRQCTIPAQRPEEDKGDEAQSQYRDLRKTRETMHYTSTEN